MPHGTSLQPSKININFKRTCKSNRLDDTSYSRCTKNSTIACVESIGRSIVGLVLTQSITACFWSIHFHLPYFQFIFVSDLILTKNEVDTLKKLPCCPLLCGMLHWSKKKHQIFQGASFNCIFVFCASQEDDYYSPSGDCSGWLRLT